MLGLVLAGLGVWQGAVWFGEQMERRQHYEMAQQAAELRGKPLLVVGGPKGSPSTRLLKTHGCGDVCLDLDPASCAGCGAEVEQVVADVRAIPYPTGYFGAVLASHILEHLETPEDALLAFQELQRVADEVHVVSPRPQSLLAWFHPGHHLWVQQQGDALVVRPMEGGQVWRTPAVR